MCSLVKNKENLIFDWFDAQEGVENQVTNKKPKTYGSIVSHKGELFKA